jgi:Protein of unknown function (DUF1194)
MTAKWIDQGRRHALYLARYNAYVKGWLAGNRGLPYASRMRCSRRSVLAILGVACLPRTVLAKTQVDLALVLAIDCSYSVDPTEYQLQMRGTGQAFLDPQVLEAVQRGPNKKIAISAFLWSDEDVRYVIVPWRLFATMADGREIAEVFLRAPRDLYRGSTATGSALLFAQSLLDSAPTSLRRVVDISTDGYANTGNKMPKVRAQLIENGITINGLSIENEARDLTAYLQTEVTGGDGHFVIKAENFEAYAAAIKMKLLKEISNADLS